MKITLDIIRQVLKEAFGYNSFIASFITEVCESASHPSAGISKDGTLYYNPDFVTRYITNKEDLFSLIFHELLHPMFGHFIYENGLLENIAADAIINAAISILYPEESRNGALFKKTHNPKGLDGLMRPMSRMGNSRYKLVYNRLYYQHMSHENKITTGELIQTLKILTPKENLSAILLIGTHNIKGGRSSNDRLPAEVVTRMADEIKQSIQVKASMQAGYFENLLSLLIEALKTHLSIRRVLLMKFQTKRKLDKFIELYNKKRIGVSPLCIYPSKRDLVLLAAGIYPSHFHNRLFHPQKRHRGLAIYLDVSGSVNQYLPKILGILKNMQREITTIFQFSNKVVETPFTALLKGEIQTTHGTDFDCIAQSIIERGFDKAIIITDGYASMNDDLKKQLTKQKLSTLTILFDDIQECEAFEPFGEIVLLEDICN